MIRSISSLTLCAALVSVAWPGTASADDAQCEAGLYEIQLPERPQRRVWCAFRQTGVSGTHTVTFDPSVGDALSQSITLPAGTWSVACFGEPVSLVVEGKDEVKSFDLSWEFLEAKPPTLDACATKPVTIGVKIPRMDGTGLKTERKGQDTEIRIVKKPQPTLAQAARSLATTAGGQAGGRSLDDTVPALVVDTLQLLAEIALERARGRAEALVLRPLVKLACGSGPGAEDGKARRGLEHILQAVLPAPEDPAATAARLLTALMPASQARLPATCAAIDGRTLAQLAESGPELSDAIGRDLLRLGNRLTQHIVTGYLESAEMHYTAELATRALDRIEALLGRVVTTGELPTPTETQLVLVALARDAAAVVDVALPAPVDPGKSKPGEPREAASAPAAPAQASATSEKDAVKSGPADHFAICATALAFAVAADCHAAGDRCDARTIAERVATPGASFALGQCETPLEGARLDWMPGWIARLTEVLMPPAGATPRDQARLSLDLTFELVDRMVRPDDAATEAALAAADAATAKARAAAARATAAARANAGGTVGGAGEAAKETDESKAAEAAQAAADLFTNRRFAADMAQGLRTLSLGLIDQDGGKAIIGGLDLIRTLAGRAQVKLAEQAVCQQAIDTSCTVEARRKAEVTLKWLRRSEHVLSRAVRIASALADNARSLQVAAADPAQAESQRQARKQSLESLIDAVTDRRWRGEDWVLSVGAGVGGLVSPPDLRPDGEDHWLSLGLTGGIAIQKLVPQDGWFGFHSQLTLVDLGYFLDIDEDTDVQWNDFVALGVQIGGVVSPSPDDAFIFGLDWRYLPAGRFARDMQLSLFIGYYVPFLDLN